MQPHGLCRCRRRLCPRVCIPCPLRPPPGSAPAPSLRGRLSAPGAFQSTSGDSDVVNVGEGAGVPGPHFSFGREGDAAEGAAAHLSSGRPWKEPWGAVCSHDRRHPCSVQGDPPRENRAHAHPEPGLGPTARQSGLPARRLLPPARAPARLRRAASGHPRSHRPGGPRLPVSPRKRTPPPRKVRSRRRGGVPPRAVCAPAARRKPVAPGVAAGSDAPGSCPEESCVQSGWKRSHWAGGGGGCGLFHGSGGQATGPLAACDTRSVNAPGPENSSVRYSGTLGLGRPSLPGCLLPGITPSATAPPPRPAGRTSRPLPCIRSVSDFPGKRWGDSVALAGERAPPRSAC